MPSIPADERTALLGPCACCRTCRSDLLRHYCRTCDAFFFTCACFRSIDDAAVHLRDHRVYMWTVSGILAIPDFDNFPFEAPTN